MKSRDLFSYLWSTSALNQVNLLSKKLSESFLFIFLPAFYPQIREQMSGPEISWYGKSILGCGLWPGLGCGKKGSGLIMSNFWGLFFHFFGVKKNLNFFLTLKKWKNGPQKLLIIGPDPFFPQSSPGHSLQLKIDFPYHEISGPDICSPICAQHLGT